MVPKTRLNGIFIIAFSVILAAVAHASIVKKTGRYQIAGSSAMVARLDTIEGTISLCQLDGSEGAFRCLEGSDRADAASSVSDHDPALTKVLKALEAR